MPNTTNKVLIIATNGRLFEPLDGSGVTEAIDEYIERILGFEKRFSVSRTVWSKVKDNALKDNPELDTTDIIKLVNGLCRSPSRTIAKVITGNYYIITAGSVNPDIVDPGFGANPDTGTPGNDNSDGVYVKAESLYLKVLAE